MPTYIVNDPEDNIGLTDLEYQYPDLLLVHTQSGKVIGINDECVVVYKDEAEQQGGYQIPESRIINLEGI